MLAILILILAHKPNAANSIPINSPYCTYSFNNGNMIRGCSTVGFFVPVEVDGDDEVYDEVMRNAPVRLALRVESMAALASEFRIFAAHFSIKDWICYFN
jgi:hypothetical protein